jgi:hypothetical protein
MLLALAGLFAVVGIVVWSILLRPVEPRKARGVITYKVFKPASQHVQYPAGMRSGFYAPNSVPISECYVMVVRVDGLEAPAGFAMNTVAAQPYEVGQTVTVQYEERGLPLLWKRIYVIDMQP